MATDPWKDIKKSRRQTIRAEMERRLKARGRTRGAVSGATGKKIGSLSKAIGKPSSLKGAGLSRRELQYAKTVRGAKKKSGATKRTYAAAAAAGKRSVGPKDPGKGNVKTYTKKVRAQDYATNVATREKTKRKLAANVSKTKAHYDKLRKKGVSKATMQKAKNKAKARSAKIKLQGSRRVTTIVN